VLQLRIGLSGGRRTSARARTHTTRGLSAHDVDAQRMSEPADDAAALGCACASGQMQQSHRREGERQRSPNEPRERGGARAVDVQTVAREPMAMRGTEPGPVDEQDAIAVAPGGSPQLRPAGRRIARRNEPQHAMSPHDPQRRGDATTADRPVGSQGEDRDRRQGARVAPRGQHRDALAKLPAPLGVGLDAEATEDRGGEDHRGVADDQRGPCDVAVVRGPRALGSSAGARRRRRRDGADGECRRAAQGYGPDAHGARHRRQRIAAAA
jgi:hypothetical protein